MVSIFYNKGWITVLGFGWQKYYPASREHFVEMVRKHLNDGTLKKCQSW